MPGPGETQLIMHAIDEQGKRVEKLEQAVTAQGTEFRTTTANIYEEMKHRSEKGCEFGHLLAKEVRAPHKLRSRRAQILIAVIACLSLATAVCACLAAWLR